MTGAALEAALIPSGGQTLLGGLYLASSADPAPAIVLLHGIPGHERNLDLAHDLRAAGLHVLYFHYRGSWGSGGHFRMDQLMDDALAALDWLVQHPRVDANRVALVGFSLGGWVALAAAAARPEVRAAVGLSPLIDPGQRPLLTEEAQAFALSFEGTDAQQLQSGWAGLMPIGQLADRLRGRHILLVTGDDDGFFAPEHYLSLPSLLPELEWVRFPRADHGFLEVRPGLRYLVRRWLTNRL